MADKKNWLQLLAYVTGSINHELLLRNEYLTAENHILKSQIKGRLRLSGGERATLAGIAKRPGAESRSPKVSSPLADRTERASGHSQAISGTPQNTTPPP